MRLRFAMLLLASLPLLAPGRPPERGREAAASRQLLLELRGPATTMQRGAAPVELVSQRRVAGAPARERRPELSTNQLVLVVLGEGNAELARVTILDPRIVRAELPGPTGELTSQTFLREDVQFPVLIPDLPGARRLEIFDPEWTGARFLLVPVGGIALP